MTIRPLSEETLSGALSVLDKQFGDDQDSSRNFYTWLSASISGSEHSEKLKKERNLDYLQYWVAFDDQSNEVVGVTGLYTKIADPDAAWLGWTSALNSEEVENKLVSYSSITARQMGKLYLVDFFDSDGKDERVQKMLARNGFSSCDAPDNTEAPEDSVHYMVDLNLDAEDVPPSCPNCAGENQGNPPPEDTRPKEQEPLAVANGMGEIHKIVRAYKNGALAAKPHSFIGSLIEKVMAEIAHDAWLQGQEAHPDCENPY